MASFSSSLWGSERYGAKMAVIDYATSTVAPAPVVQAGVIPFNQQAWLNAPEAPKPTETSETATPATSGKRPRWGKKRKG